MRGKSHSSRKTLSLSYFTRRAVRSSAETTATSRSCHTRVRCSIKWLPGNTARLLEEEQCGFRLNRSTTDMIFAVRRLQEIRRKAGVSLFMCFVGLQTAYDTTDRTLLWQALTRIGVLAQMIAVIQQIHDGMRACVRPDGVCSDCFEVERGVPQGYVLHPHCFLKSSSQPC